MNYQTITVQALTPTLGAEIHGVDLAKPLTPIQFKEIQLYLLYIQNQGLKQSLMKIP